MTVLLFFCGEISNYKNIIVKLRQNTLEGIDPGIDLAPSPPNRNKTVFHNELNLSTIGPLSNRMQRTLKAIQIGD